jgi:hypothetical protein
MNAGASGSGFASGNAASVQVSASVEYQTYRRNCCCSSACPVTTAVPFADAIVAFVRTCDLPKVMRVQVTPSGECQSALELEVAYLDAIM